MYKWAELVPIEARKRACQVAYIKEYSKDTLSSPRTVDGKCPLGVIIDRGCGNPTAIMAIHGFWQHGWVQSDCSGKELECEHDDLWDELWLFIREFDNGDLLGRALYDALGVVCE